MNDKEMLDAVQRNVNAGMAAMRTELNRQLFADACPRVTYVPPTRWQRVRTRVSRYVANWREALYAVGRASIGRDAIPDCDYDHY